MAEVTIFFPVCTQYVFTVYAFEALLRSVDLEKYNVVVLLNSASREITEYFESKKIVASFEIKENASFENFSTLLNTQLEDLKTDYFAIVHNDTIVTKNWLDSLLSVFKDQINYFHLNYPNNGPIDLSLLELAAVCPYTSYSQFDFLTSPFVKKKFLKVKPSNRVAITDAELESFLSELYGESLDEFVKRISKSTESWYSYVNQVESYCVLINTGAFKKACKKFDERFVGAGGEIRQMCRQFQRRGYLFARANNVFVHHHGNLTNDSLGLSYTNNVKFNNDLFEKLEVCDD